MSISMSSTVTRRQVDTNTSFARRAVAEDLKMDPGPWRPGVRTTRCRECLTGKTPGQGQTRMCRRKMRMSGLCKVEMSAFMDVRGPHGDGANHFEPTRTGPVESVARGTAEASFAGSSSGAAESNRPPGAADAAADYRDRGWCPGSRIT